MLTYIMEVRDNVPELFADFYAIMEAKGEDVMGAERVVAVVDDVIEGYGGEYFLAVLKCCGVVDGACGDEV